MEKITISKKELANLLTSDILIRAIFECRIDCSEPFSKAKEDFLEEFPAAIKYFQKVFEPYDFIDTKNIEEVKDLIELDDLGEYLAEGYVRS